jgi:hypothetical protein
MSNVITTGHVGIKNIMSYHYTHRTVSKRKQKKILTIVSSSEGGGAPSLLPCWWKYKAIQVFLEK